MKRQQFLITSTVGHRVTKNAWNSSLREIEKLVREVARHAGTAFNLVASESVKEGFNHVSGSRTWENQQNRSRVVFSITRLAS